MKIKFSDRYQCVDCFDGGSDNELRRLITSGNFDVVGVIVAWRKSRSRTQVKYGEDLVRNAEGVDSSKWLKVYA